MRVRENGEAKMRAFLVVLLVLLMAACGVLVVLLVLVMAGHSGGARAAVSHSASVEAATGTQSATFVRVWFHPLTTVEARSIGPTTPDPDGAAACLMAWERYSSGKTWKVPVLPAAASPGRSPPVLAVRRTLRGNAETGLAVERPS
ncbi:hypothetical protein ACIBQ1_34285 [Nonomuraea sp. NPDC050153]|uniref:hypothetical protein n=1 Tax=Nonomuraea sp. NPDC050153 TaxID=3364359 RepID=UPI00379F1DD3